MNKVIQTSNDIQNFIKPHITTPAEEIPVIETKNLQRKKARARKQQQELERNQPLNLKWFFFGAILIGTLLTVISQWTSSPDQEYIKPNHVQRAKYKKYMYSQGENHYAKGYTKSY